MLSADVHERLRKAYSLGFFQRGDRERHRSTEAAAAGNQHLLALRSLPQNETDALSQMLGRQRIAVLDANETDSDTDLFDVHGELKHSGNALGSQQSRIPDILAVPEREP